MPRSYVVALQKKARDLRIRLAALTENEDEGLDPELLVRGAGLVKMKEGDEPSFLGPSSGIAMTRLVIELAKDLGKLKKVSDLVPDERSRAIREHFGMETSKPSSKSYPDISSVAAPGLPSRELTNCLVENFFKKGRSRYMSSLSTADENTSTIPLSRAARTNPSLHRRRSVPGINGRL